MKVKYTILVPVYNGMPYIQTCIDSIINQDYQDYELVISNDNSNDGTNEYLKCLHHPKIKIVETPQRMSMTEHWEWALSYSTGEWVIFVGQDDALHSYFFQIVDKLTTEAQSIGIRSISSRRSYFFWRGCEEIYNERISYHAFDSIKIKSTFFGALKALLYKDYFDLPQMYCTSLFHRSLIEEARSLQNGQLLSVHPQDANLAAIAISLEKRYLRSEIPFGWIGTSNKSAGLAVTVDGSDRAKGLTDSIQGLSKEYQHLVEKSKFNYNYLAGNFKFSDISVYFWQALIQTENLRPAFIQRILLSRPFKYLLFSSSFIRIILRNLGKSKFMMLKEIINRNKLNINIIYSISIFLLIVYVIYNFLNFIFIRIPRKSFDIILNHKVSYSVSVNSVRDVTLSQASNIVKNKIKEKGWV